MLALMLDAEDIKPDRIRPLKRSEYAKLGRLGAFDGQRVELLHGQVVVMSPIGARHATLTRWLTRYLIQHLDASFDVSPGDADVETRAAALRKRFERAKERLKKLALEHGLV